jgi:hypothetical protein
MPVAAFALNNSLDVDKKCPLMTRGSEAAGLKCLNGLPDHLTIGREERSTLFGVGIVQKQKIAACGGCVHPQAAIF